MACGAYDDLYIKMDLAKTYMKKNPEGDTAGMNQFVKDTMPVLWDHYFGTNGNKLPGQPGLFYELFCFVEYTNPIIYRIVGDY